jgi:hypothetical protein
MELTEVQKQTVRRWIAEGCGLADVQKRLAEELQVTLTYMDVRFLVLELGVALKERPKKAPVNVDAMAKVAPAGGASALAEEPEDAEAGAGAGAGGGAVRVQVDRVTKPGAVVSGTVAFSDGVSATWFLDQYGRLGLSASRPGYKPADADVKAFQRELQTVLERSGF